MEAGARIPPAVPNRGKHMVSYLVCARRAIGARITPLACELGELELVMAVYAKGKHRTALVKAAAEQMAACYPLLPG